MCFLKFKFMLNIQAEIFDVLLYRDSDSPHFTVNGIVKHRFFFILGEITIALVLPAFIVNLFASIHCRAISIS